jgi:hypothetical protein
MSELDLSSCWAKFRRAEAHIDSLEREIVSWVASNPYRLAKQTSSDFTRHGYVIGVLNEPDLERWSLIASDAIHNLRCALDHVIYAIAVFQSGTDPPPDADTLAFPICDTPERFRGARRKIRALSERVRSELEAVQPYNRAHPRLPPLLGLLRDFNDSDKHKILHVAMAQLWNANFQNVDTSVLLRGEQVQLWISMADVMDGAEIAAIIYPRPSLDMQHRLLTSVVVSVQHRSSPLNRTRSELAEIIDVLPIEVREVIERISRVA